VAKAVNTEGSPTTLHWSGQAVDVQAIDAALAHLRQKAADAAPAEGAALGTRTSVLTLVAYALDPAAAQRAGETIAALPEYHPSRSLVVLAQPSDDEPTIDAHLSAHCHIAPGLEGQVCFEEVELIVMGRAARHLHSVVLPLLVSDLPVFSWWSGDLPGDLHLLSDVLDASDRFVADSTHFSDAQSGLPCLAGLVEHTATAVSDLSWARLTSWRQVIAHAFDSPDLRPYLDDLTALDIEHDTGSAAQALLLVGWLAARLGWQPEGEANHAYRLRSATGTVLATLRGQSSGDEEPGSLLAARLVASRGDGEATLSIRRSRPNLATVAAQTPKASLERTVQLAGAGDPEMLAQELEMTGRDRFYEEALAMAAAMLGGQGSGTKGPG
jgi:glucose-6-phosphate dehydrogenase assembly protein OpcA